MYPNGMPSVDQLTEDLVYLVNHEEETDTIAIVKEVSFIL